MEGRCPECDRSYKISKEFLAMGGKAKCPHCLLELMFATQDIMDEEQIDPGVEQDMQPEPEEIDAHCLPCRRRYKVDLEYLERGGATKCPHCGEELIIDSEFNRGLGIMNPSIYNHNEKLIVNLRAVNYTFYHSEKKIFQHPYGPLTYLHPENDVKLRTWNYYLELDDDYNITRVNKIDTTI